VAAASAARREAFFDAAGTFTSALVAPTELGPMLVNAEDVVISRRLFARGRLRELAQLDAALGHLQAVGQVRSPAAHAFLDVGANIGSTTLGALKRHGFAYAYAIEPHPANHQLLTLNVAMHELGPRVRSFEIAAADQRSRVTLTMGTPGNFGDYRVAVAPQEEPGITVETETLDALGQHGGLDDAHVGLIWMDVQGSEGHVLAGASALVTRGVPVVLELHPEMLAQRGGFELLEAAAQEHYTHVVDLRGKHHRRRTTRELADIAANIPSGRFTDVLLMRCR